MRRLADGREARRQVDGAALRRAEMQTVVDVNFEKQRYAAASSEKKERLVGKGSTGGRAWLD